MLTATVSGSFHRHMVDIYYAVNELQECGVSVLSPADPRVVDGLGEFLFVASDPSRSIRLVQDRHMECIRASDFLWLVTPDGYVGQSASMELGFAVAYDVPIFSSTIPYDLTLQQYVQQVPDLNAAITAARSMAHTRARADIFKIDPLGTIEVAQDRLEQLQRSLRQAPHAIDDIRAREIYADREKVSQLLRTSSAGSVIDQQILSTRSGERR